MAIMLMLLIMLGDGTISHDDEARLSTVSRNRSESVIIVLT